MVLFFLLVGCEIKREILQGELNSARKRSLPLIAAIFGMFVPAVIYMGFNHHDKNLLQGWAIPSATDIAFALGVLSLLGKKIPLSLKTLLTAIAIFDDAGAIMIIAFFYTHSLHLNYLFSALVIFLGLGLLHYFNSQKLFFYLLLGSILWFCILKSGIHPTIAGILLAMMLPKNALALIEKYLHPWVAYFILPVFAIANTGIDFSGAGFSQHIFSNLSLGIITGLFLGKQLGIFTTIWIAVKCGISKLPAQTNFTMIYGMALLCGVGFTMSLFIGGLAFNDPVLTNTIRMGVLGGSILSALAGYVVLNRNLKNPVSN